MHDTLTIGIQNLKGKNIELESDFSYFKSHIM